MKFFEAMKEFDLKETEEKYKNSLEQIEDS